jgi:ABC-type transport system involved in Fe-S cluster assembly fused permease/ATPase subunit
VTQESLREIIGVVPQDTVLFNNNFYYNIEYGAVSQDSQKSRIMIEQAAKDANIHDFIMSTPDKYDTIVGERGLKVSGGQRQRVKLFFLNFSLFQDCYSEDFIEGSSYCYFG